jgi:hypothetical protein
MRKSTGIKSGSQAEAGQATPTINLPSTCLKVMRLIVFIAIYRDVGIKIAVKQT